MTVRAPRPIAAACIALAALLPGCGETRPGAPAVSVLLVTIDTLRADAAGAWGGPAVDTPRLDALAAAGVRFDAASTVTPLTLPAHASMLTGLRPARHGLTVNGVARPRLPVPTLAERLRAAGWRTAAFVSTTVLDRRHGLAAGFERYDDELAVPGGPASPTERRGDATVDRALAWPGWSAPRAFAWVHLFDPHAPYAAPGAAAGEDRAAYQAEVRYVDAQLGRLLDGVRAAAQGPWLVIVTSDHGEGLGEHDEETHGLLLHESTMHVPLAAAWLDGAPPGEAGAAFPPGAVRTDPVSVLDVAPTVLEAAGLPAEAGVDGRPLQRAQLDRALPLETRVPWFYYGFSPLVGVRRGSEKLVGAPRAEPPRWTAYDLAADPAERDGRVVADHPLLAAVRSPEPDEEGLPAGDAAPLLALGYLGDVARAREEGPLPDPRDEMLLLRTLDRAHTAVVTGEPAQALELLAALPARLADVPERLYVEGRALLALDRPGEAAAVFERAVARRPTAALLAEWGGALLRLADRGQEAPARAAAVLDRALEIAPEDPHALALRATADLMSGEAASALARVEAVSRERPQDLELLAVRLRALRALGRAAEADAVAAQLRALAPGHPALR